MKLRTSVATAVAATAAVLAVGAAPANAATTAPAAKNHTSVSINASTRWAHYGQWITLTAHLGKTSSNRDVTIYRSPAGERTQVVKSGKVDRYGNLRAQVWMGRNTAFTVRFAGDAKDTAASSTVNVHDAAVVKGYLIKADYSSNGWAYYKVGSKHYPTLVGTVSPNKAGEAIWFHLQVYYKGQWVNVNTSSLPVNSDGTFGAFWSGPRAGWSWRVSANFNGDSTNDGSGYAWHYFKTVK